MLRHHSCKIDYLRYCLNQEIFIILQFWAVIVGLVLVLWARFLAVSLSRCSQALNYDGTWPVHFFVLKLPAKLPVVNPLNE